MRAQEQRRRVGARAADAHDEVPSLATDGAPRFVDLDAGAEGLALARQAHGDRALAPRMAVDTDEVEEKARGAIAVGSAKPRAAAHE